jgi:predicted nucleic acid-binding protein
VTAHGLVLDASVGVKWFREEPGSPEARDLLRACAAGDVRLAVPTVFLYEVLDVARRHLGAGGARRVWHAFSNDEVAVLGPDAELVELTLEVAERLGCTLYDAAAPALAQRLGWPLASADRRAHGDVPGVMLIG